MRAVGLHEIRVELRRQLEPYTLIRKDGPDPEHAREAEEIDEILLSLARRITVFQFGDEHLSGPEHAMRRNDRDADRVEHKMRQ